MNTMNTRARHLPHILHKEIDVSAAFLFGRGKDQLYQGTCILYVIYTKLVIQQVLVEVSSSFDIIDPA